MIIHWFAFCVQKLGCYGKYDRVLTDTLDGKGENFTGKNMFFMVFFSFDGVILLYIL